jgi:hypothetical protein
VYLILINYLTFNIDDIEYIHALEIVQLKQTKGELKMKMYFISSVEIRHPETREKIVFIGQLLKPFQLENLAVNYGIDEILGRIILANNMGEACDLASKLGI